MPFEVAPHDATPLEFRSWASTAASSRASKTADSSARRRSRARCTQLSPRDRTSSPAPRPARARRPPSCCRSCSGCSPPVGGTIRVLVLAPTRELAVQITDDFTGFAYRPALTGTRCTAAWTTTSHSRPCGLAPRSRRHARATAQPPDHQCRQPQQDPGARGGRGRPHARHGVLPDVATSSPTPRRTSDPPLHGDDVGDDHAREQSMRNPVIQIGATGARRPHPAHAHLMPAREKGKTPPGSSGGPAPSH